MTWLGHASGKEAKDLFTGTIMGKSKLAWFNRRSIIMEPCLGCHHKVHNREVLLGLTANP